LRSRALSALGERPDLSPKMSMGPPFLSGPRDFSRLHVRPVSEGLDFPRLALDDRARFSNSPGAPTFEWGAAGPLESLKSARSHCLWLILERSTFALAHLASRQGQRPIEVGRKAWRKRRDVIAGDLEHGQGEASSVRDDSGKHSRVVGRILAAYAGQVWRFHLPHVWDEEPEP